MKKSELQSLTVGMWIVSKKDNSKHQITAVVEETGKIGLDGHKVYTFSTIQRWYDVAKAQNGGLEPEDIVTEDTTQVEEQDTTEQTNTSDLQDTDTQGNEIHEDTEQTGQQDVVEANTGTIRQNNLITDINNLMDLHDVQMEAKKEYIKVSMPGKRGALCMIRQTRYGTGIHIDFKSKILAKLDENYRGMLIEKYNCHIYDKTRGYFRIFDCNDTQILETIILTAKQFA